MKLNFVNHPIIRFRKASMQTISGLKEAVYDKFKIQEDIGSQWKDDCFDALQKDDKEKLAMLEKERGKVILVDDMIDCLIDNFTMANPNQESIDFFMDLITRNKKYIQGIEVRDNPKQLIFKTKIGDIKATKLSDAYPHFKTFPNIEDTGRHGKCHPNSIIASVNLQQPNKIATAYVYTFGEGFKWLHSWIETDLDGKPVVIDVTRNLIMPRKGYYYFHNITGPIYKISSKTLQKEEYIYKTIHAEYDWFIKLYLTNRHQAMQLYRMIQEEKEKQRMADPLYVAAKHMHDSFEKNFEKQFKREQKGTKKEVSNSSQAQPS